jgi:hypothetical protein
VPGPRSPPTSLVTVTAGALVLYGVSRQTASAGDINPATGTTLVINTTGTGRRTILCSEARPTAGDTGTRTFNATDATSLGMAAVNAAFRPAAGGPSAIAPTVDAGADTSVVTGGTLTRTATELANGATITSRAWTIVSGPAGLGSTIGTSAALSWSPTTAGLYTLRYSATNSAGTGTDDVQVNVTGTTPGALASLWTGVPDGDSVPITVRTTNTATVRLLVGTDAAVSVGTFNTSPVAPDADGYAKFNVAALSAGTTYWYRAEVDGVLNTASTGSFTTDTPTTARSFRVAFASCLTSNNTDGHGVQQHDRQRARAVPAPR